MSIERRIRRLEARRDIEQLRHQYCYHLDDGDLNALVDLFVEDGTLDFGPLGSATGRPEILSFVEGMLENFEFTVHMVHSPVIELDGETASGRWYLEVPAVTVEGTAQWIHGEYLETYRDTEDGWKISDTTAEFNYIADYEDGWADELL